MPRTLEYYTCQDCKSEVAFYPVEHIECLEDYGYVLCDECKEAVEGGMEDV